MKQRGPIQAGLIMLACAGMLLPPTAVQAAELDPQPSPMPTAIDLALQEGGLLLGQALDAQGRPLAGVAVSVRQLDREVAATTVDASGFFAVRGLRGGEYQIVAGQATGFYRLWAPNTAPPSAQRGALLVAGGRQVLGQKGPIVAWLSNPWVLAGLVAAAVAIPIAIHNHQLERSREPASP